MSHTTGTTTSKPSNAERQRAVFDIVTILKTLGYHDTLDLPQIVVCGDQSSGKSSVLSSIARLDFPTKDIVCTTFATELIMRKTRADESDDLNIQIVPSESRSEDEKVVLERWQPRMSDLGNFSDIIAEAGAAMQLGNGVTSFSDDILRVELSGPELQNLDLVDLPGLFHSAGQGQTRADVTRVKNMVVKYMERKRVVVLAIISAKDDLAGQVVTNMVGECDAATRTLAVVTKPDMLDEEPNKQQEYLNAMANDIPELTFGLGWHVLRNKKYTEQDKTWEQRDTTEAEYFRKDKWADVPSSQKGIKNLVHRLQQIQEQRIIASAKSLHQDVQATVYECEQELLRLVPSPLSAVDLVTIGQNLQELLLRAANGPYTHAFFKDAPDAGQNHKKLALVIEDILAHFSTDMRTRGHTWQIDEEVHTAYTHSSQQHPRIMSKADFIKTTTERLQAARAMPGQFVDAILDDLFYEQAQQWPGLIEDMVEQVVTATRNCLLAIVVYLCDAITDHQKFFDIVLQPCLDAARADFESHVHHKMSAFLSRRPITLDTKTKSQTVPDAFKDEWRLTVQGRLPVLMDIFKSIGSASLSRLDSTTSESLSTRVMNLLLEDVSIESFNGAVILASLKQYYKTQLQRTIDHFDLDSIHSNFLSTIASALTPAAVSSRAPQLATLTVEDSTMKARRDELSSRLEHLKVAMRGLEILSRSDQASKKRAANERDGPATPAKKGRDNKTKSAAKRI